MFFRFFFGKERAALSVGGGRGGVARIVDGGGVLQGTGLDVGGGGVGREVLGRLVSFEGRVVVVIVWD